MTLIAKTRTYWHGAQRAPYVRPTCRAGQALVEFAVVTVVVYLLLAATIEFGRAYLASQTIQSAADFAARELSRTPLPPTKTFNEALFSTTVQTQVYSEDWLAIDVSSWSNGGNNQTLMDYLDSLATPMPPVNRMLVPLMFIEKAGTFDKNSGTVSTQTVTLLRFPGALITSQTAASGYTVQVPMTASDGTTQIIHWHRVLEELGVDPSDAANSVFSVVPATAGSQLPTGLAAVRINYPFQAATMSSFRSNVNPNSRSNMWDPVNKRWNVNLANDAGVQQSNSPLEQRDGFVGLPEPAAVGPGTYSGKYGLGQQEALGLNIRPFRRVLSGQAIYRREIFGNDN